MAGDVQPSVSEQVCKSITAQPPKNQNLLHGKLD